MIGRREEIARIARAWYGPAALAAAFILAFGALLWFLELRVDAERRESLPADAELARQSLRSRLDRNRDHLVLMAEDLARGLLDEVAFQDRATRFAADHPEISKLFWVGSDLVIHRAAPLGPDEKPVGAAIVLPERKEAALAAAESRGPVYTRPFADGKGNTVFEIWVPVFRAGELLGLFSVAYSCEKLLRQAPPPSVLRDYRLTLLDDAGAVVAQTPAAASIDPGMTRRAALDPPGHGTVLVLQHYGTGILGWGMTLLSLLCAGLALGMAYGMYALKRDIARRRQAEEARDRLSMAVEQAGEAIVITDTLADIVYVNPAFERVTGYPESEALGRNPRFLKSGRHDADFYEGLWSTLLRGEVWTGRFINRRKDGILYEEEAVISPVRDASGGVVNYVAVKRDVTRERQMEEQLRESQKMEAVGRLAGGIAHEFNNLLTAVTGYSDLLLHRLGSDNPVRKDIEVIKKAGERAASLTGQLLAFGRRQMLRPQALDLNAVVGRMDKVLHRVIGEDVELRFVAGEGLLPVMADPGQIEQVLLELAANARDAMPRGGMLTIETSNALLDGAPGGGREGGARRGFAMIAVSDTGRGMDEATLQRVFEPFFTTKETGKGTGLGLSTVYGIVTQSGGHIEADSAAGRGTTFRIYLPGAEAAAEPAQAAPVPGPTEGHETILLVEDEAVVRELVRTILAKEGYTVLDAPDGVEAIRVSAAHDGPIHLLLTDVVMPRMGGREVAERLASRRPGMKVAYMSGYAEDAVAGGDAPGDRAAFIRKPFLPRALARMVRDVLEGRRPEG